MRPAEQRPPGSRQKPKGYKWGSGGFLRLSLLKPHFSSPCGPRTQLWHPSPCIIIAQTAHFSKCFLHMGPSLPSNTQGYGLALLHYSQMSQAVVGSPVGIKEVQPNSPMKTAHIRESRQGRGPLGLSKHPFPSRAHQWPNCTCMLSDLSGHFSSHLKLEEVVPSQTH